MVPFHPAVVHLPLGLALLSPLLALGLALAYWKGWLPKRSFWAVIGTQALLVIGAFLAMQTGEAEEDAVERLVSHAAVEAHEEAAALFLWGAVAALVVSTLVGLIRSDRFARPLSLVAVVAALVVAGLGVNVGKAGGELVYVHGAAATYAGAPGGKPTSPAIYGEDDYRDGGDRRHRRGHHDDD
jgi:uncharacterized membrane protein